MSAPLPVSLTHEDVKRLVSENPGVRLGSVLDSGRAEGVSSICRILRELIHRGDIEVTDDKKLYERHRS